MVSPRSSRNRAQVQAKSNKPVYTVDEPTLDELFPSKPGIYSMRDLNVDVLGKLFIIFVTHQVFG